MGITCREEELEAQQLLKWLGSVKESLVELLAEFEEPDTDDEDFVEEDDDEATQPLELDRTSSQTRRSSS